MNRRLCVIKLDYTRTTRAVGRLIVGNYRPGSGSELGDGAADVCAYRRGTQRVNTGYYVHYKALRVPARRVYARYFCVPPFVRSASRKNSAGRKRTKQLPQKESVYRFDSFPKLVGMSGSSRFCRRAGCRGPRNTYTRTVIQRRDHDVR